MAESTMTTSWMWAHNNGVQGVLVNRDSGRLHWYDNPGCACDDNSQEQTIDDFLAHGPLYGSPPDDVSVEMRAALQSIV